MVIARVVRRLRAMGGPVVLLGAALAFWWFEALYGFNPTEDGFVLAQAWRIRWGEIPHVDFTSPRPLGSALLHLPEVFLGSGMLAASRLVVTLELLVIAAVFTHSGRTGRTMGAIGGTALVLLAFLVDVGNWPITAWHTIDGLFLAAVAVWLVPRATAVDGAWRWILVWCVAGMAPLTKQGFLLVPIIVALEVWRIAGRRALRFAPAIVLPWLAFLAWTHPGLAAIRAQSAGFTSDNIRSLAVPLDIIVSGSEPLALGLGVVCAFVAMRIATSTRYGKRMRDVFAPIILALPTLMLGASTHFAMENGWALVPCASLVVVTFDAWLRTRDREVLVQLVQISLLGYAATISWSVPVPSLISGIALARAIVIVLGVNGTGRRVRATGAMVTTAILSVLTIVASVLVVQARAAEPFLDVPRARLVHSVSTPAFRGVHVSAQVSAFEGSLQRCLREHPARWVTIAPVGAGEYPTLGVRNPFGIDWWLDREVPQDHLVRVERVAQRLNASGDWLVLRLTYDPVNLSAMTVAAVTRPGAAPLPAPGMDRILATLHGRQITCGSLVGEWAPAR